MRGFTLAIGLGLFVAAGSSPAMVDFGSDPRVAQFVQDVSTRHGLDHDAVAQLIAQATYRPEIIEAISSPAEQLPWYRYRPIFLTDERIRAGIAFWTEHEALLDAVAERYGVAPEILVAIIGVETFYGRYQGRHRVIDALLTLGFDYPPRADFFRRELEQYLLLAHEEGIDPLEPTGSYAGAMGMPQFISSSYRAYAVDGNDDGRRDLFTDPADIIASVANYFRRHGWRQDEPVAMQATVEGKSWGDLLTQDLRPGHTVATLRDAGVRFESAGLNDDMPARLLELELTQGKEYWATLHNFYVITRYNHSPLYAMVVHQLSEAIRQQRG